MKWQTRELTKTKARKHARTIQVLHAMCIGGVERGYLKEPVKGMQQQEGQWDKWKGWRERSPRPRPGSMPDR